MKVLILIILNLDGHFRWKKIQTNRNVDDFATNLYLK